MRSKGIDADDNTFYTVKEGESVVQKKNKITIPVYVAYNSAVDSQYVVLGINRNFVSKTNKSYWRDLKQALTIKHSQIKVHHVMGHQDNVGNNIADLSMRAMLDELVAKRKNHKK